jgi:uncharacterized protein (UPF0261 family)
LTGVGPTRHNREKYLASGKVLPIDEIRAMTRFPVDEMLVGARMYAEKINKAKGPIKMVIPLKGWSSIDAPGSILHDPEEDLLFVNELKKCLQNPIEIEEIDANLEDFRTAEVLVNSLDAMMGFHSKKRG